jgi:transposase-like protein
MTSLTKSRRQFMAQQKQAAVELCLSESLSRTDVAQRLGIPISSLAKWVRLNGPSSAGESASSGGEMILSGWRQRQIALEKLLIHTDQENQYQATLYPQQLVPDRKAKSLNSTQQLIGQLAL